MANGNTLCIFTPLDMQINGSGNATLGNRNGHFTLEFPSGVPQSAFFGGVLPQQYNNNGLVVYLHYAMASSSGQNVMWAADFSSYGTESSSNNIGTYTPGAQNTVVSISPSVFGQIKRDSITFTDGLQIQFLNGGDYFFLTVTRFGNNASDTAFGNAQLLAVEIKEL